MAAVNLKIAVFGDVTALKDAIHFPRKAVNSWWTNRRLSTLVHVRKRVRMTATAMVHKHDKTEITSAKIKHDQPHDPPQIPCRYTPWRRTLIYPEVLYFQIVKWFHVYK